MYYYILCLLRIFMKQTLEQLIIKPFCDNFIFWSSCFLKLGPIFVNLWSSEPKSNHKNNKLAPILGQKSLFGGLCNGVRQKWGHASFLGLIWTEAFRCSRFVWIFSSKVSTVNTDSSLENNWLEDLWTKFLALSFFFLCIDRL